MNTFDCMASLETAGYTFTLTPDARVLAKLLGGMPPPAEAAPMLAYLKEHRDEVVSELRARSMAGGPTAATQTRLAPARESTTRRMQMDDEPLLQAFKAARLNGEVEIIHVRAHVRSGFLDVEYRPLIEGWVLEAQLEAG